MHRHAAYRCIRVNDCRLERCSRLLESGRFLTTGREYRAGGQVVSQRALTVTGRLNEPGNRDRLAGYVFPRNHFVEVDPVGVCEFPLGVDFLGVAFYHLVLGLPRRHYCPLFCLKGCWFLARAKIFEQELHTNAQNVVVNKLGCLCLLPITTKKSASADFLVWWSLFDRSQKERF